MKLTNIIFSFGMMAGALSMSAEVIHLDAPGTLATVAKSSVGATTLTVTGQMNASDFAFINDKMLSLTDLDLSGVTITAYDGAPVGTARTLKSPAGVLPEYSLNIPTLVSVKLPATVTSIGQGAFAGSGVTSVAFPASLQSIGKGAFSGSALQSVSIPANVTVGDLAFSGCDNLDTVHYGAAVIPDGAFKGDTGLKNLSVTSSLTSIGNSAFEGCEALSHFAFGSNLKSIGASAFKSSGLTSVSFNQAHQLSSIGDWAFADCTKLESFTMHDAVANLGQGVLFGDEALQSLVLPEDMPVVPDYFLKGAKTVDTAHIMGVNTESVGKYAYAGMSGLTDVVMSDQLTHIGDNAMEGLTGLTSIAMSETATVPTLGKEVWKGVNQSVVELIIPEDLEPGFSSTEQWKEFKINALPTSIDNVQANAQSNVKAWFDGHVLYVETTQPIKSADVHNMTGQRLVSVNGSGMKLIKADTSKWSDNIYLITVNTADGKSHTVKLTR